MDMLYTLFWIILGLAALSFIIGVVKAEIEASIIKQINEGVLQVRTPDLSEDWVRMLAQSNLGPIQRKSKKGMR